MKRLAKNAVLKTLDAFGYELHNKPVPLSPLEPYGRQMYCETFSPESVATKTFYNFGSGKWRHPFWTNIDYSSDYYGYADDLIDIKWNITSGKPLPVETGSADLVYCSHTVEHLLDEHIDWMLSEARRILKPNGVARVTTPNIELYYQAYRRGDVFFSYHYGYGEKLGLGEDKKDALARWLVNEFATQLVQEVFPGHIPYFKTPAEIRHILDAMPMNDALAKITSLLDFDIQRRTPGNHVNWWTNEKLSAALKRAGFNSTIITPAGGSIVPVMRDRRFFDTVNPAFSLFVEGLKT